jgi:hypothetical protein
MKVSARVAVSAYFDGRAERIQSAVLAGIDRFERQVEAQPEQLAVRVTGQRSSRTFQGLAGLAWLAVGAAGLAAGGVLVASGALPVGAAVAALGTYLGSFSEYHLSQWNRAKDWSGGELELGRPPKSSLPEASLASILEKQQQAYPSAQQVVYLAGHGNHQQVGPLGYRELAQQMQGQQVQHTVLNTCLAGQLEVMTQVAPWSRTILASPQPIPARGLPVEKMFASDMLAAAPSDRMKSWVEQSRGLTPSLLAIDGEQFCRQLLPALDKLGEVLSRQERTTLVSVLRASRTPDWGLSERVDLGSFLEQLEKRLDCPEVQVAREALQDSILAVQNQRGLTFRLDPDAEVVPPGWKAFLEKADRRYKPWGL